MFIIIKVYLGSEFCATALKTLGLRVLTRYIRAFSMFNVCFASKNCPTKCTSVANVVYRDVDVFGTKTVSRNRAL
jgi:hypothetical protein